MGVSNWLLKNFNNSQTNRLLCDTCGKLQPIKGMRKIFGGICICDQCIDTILARYISTSLIKLLCPHCYGKESNTEKCNFCDLTLPTEK